MDASETRQNIVLEKHSLGWSQRQIATHLNVSRGYVRGVLKNAYDILRDRDRPEKFLVKRRGFPGVWLSLEEMKRYGEVYGSEKIGTHDDIETEITPELVIQNS